MGTVYNAQACHKTALHVANFESCNHQFQSCSINIYIISKNWKKSWRLSKLVLPKLKPVIVRNLVDYQVDSSEKTERLGQMINANCVHVW